MHVIPQSWSHLHILISVFPSVGLLLVLGVYIAGFRTGNDFVRRTCLFVFAMVGLLSIPILVSGLLSMADLSANPRFAKDAINTHLIWGMVALGVLLISGAVAGFELWRSWRARRPSGDPFHLVRSEEHTSELQSPCNLVCRLLLEKKKHHQGAAGRARPEYGLALRAGD